MADLQTIHSTKPLNRTTLLIASLAILLLGASVACWLLTHAGAGATYSLAFLAASLVLLPLTVQFRKVQLERDGAGLIYTGLLGRRRELRGLTEVVGRSVRPWSSSPALRVVVFREDQRDALRLLAFNWDLDMLDRLADDLALPIRNETVRPRLQRAGVLRQPRIA